MRVSELQIYTTFLNNIQRLRLDNLETQNQISSGRTINAPSDDPIGFDRVVSGKALLAVTDQRLRNIQTGRTRLDSTDAALSSTTSLLFRAKELAVQMRNDSNTAAERAIGAIEVNQLLQEARQIANTRVNGVALFTGTSTHGRATGLRLRTPVTLTNGTNDSLVVSVDGVTSSTLDLTSLVSEVLTGDQLAARLQSRMNTNATLLAAGKSVTVTFETDHLVIASDKAGPTSTVQVISGSGLSALGFSGGSTSTGSVPFQFVAQTSAGIGNLLPAGGGGIIGQGIVRDQNLMTLDNYLIQFSSATTFAVHNISRPVVVTPGLTNAGIARSSDSGVSDPSHVRLDNYEIRPESFFTITTGVNDVLRIDPGSGGGPVTVTVPSGRYTADQFATAVQTAMNLAVAETYTVTFNGPTGEFSIQNDPGNATALQLLLNDPLTTIENTIGFTPNLTTVLVGKTVTGTDAIVTSGAELRTSVQNTTVNSAMFTLTKANNTLYVNGAPVTLTEGSYTGAELAAEIQTRTSLTTAYNTATPGPPARLFTITTGGATINHSNAGSTVSALLGYDPIDTVGGADISDFDAGTTAYLNNTNLDFGGLRVVLQNVTGPPRHGDTFAVVLNSTVVLANQAYTSQAAINFEGLQVSIRNGGGGPPAANDVFRVLVRSEYQGDSGIRAIEVQENQTVQTTLPGNQVFSGTTIDLLTALVDLHAALKGNFGGGIAQGIQDVDTSLEQVSTGVGDIGALSNRLDSTARNLSLTQELVIRALSETEDADLFQVISDLTRQEIALQAAAQAGARIFDTTLLNFLR